MEKNVALLDTLDASHLAEVSDVAQLALHNKKSWYRKRNLRMLYLALVPVCLGVEMTSGYDGSVLNGLQAVTRWQSYFNYPEGTILGIMNAIYGFGSVFAIPFVAWFNDRYGRRAVIIIGTFFCCVGVALQTGSINIGMFLAGRFIIGIGIPFSIAGASALITELTYPSERAVIGGLFNESWYVGSILAAGITLGTYSMDSDWSWRLPSLFQIFPSLLQIFFIWFVPESPRWLVSKDRDEEAFEILVKYHAEGDREDSFVLAEFAQIRDTLALEKENSKHRWVELFQTKANLHRVLIASCVGLFSQWSGNGLVSYYLAKVLTSIGITSTLRQNQINLGLQCWNLVSGVTGAFLTKLLGRRTQYLLAFSGMTIVFACWTGASANFAQTANQNAAGAVIGMIFIYYGCYNQMHPLTYIYVPEVFPFYIRAKGTSITQFFTRASSAFNTFVNPIGLANLGWKFYIVYVVWLAIETCTIFFVYVETKGPSLEELAVLFEGKDAKVGQLPIKKQEATVEQVEERD